ncbi:MAG TPA: putative baseplate assembly protein [Thermoanaerobaculia bacterium]|jgi:predicted phage baseplate assembly protein
MPILPPSLDDRGFDDLVAEAIARIPAHTPEWTDVQPGDPGLTLVELFAWLVDTLLYRANLIPERQRLAFLRLLGEPMRPATAARGLVTVRLEEESARAVTLVPLARVSGPPDFETLSELTVLPVAAEAYVKRPLTDREASGMSGLVAGLRDVYGLGRRFGVGYVTTPAFPAGAAVPAGLDLVSGTVDRCLWLALLAPKPELVGAVRDTLGGKDGTPRLLSVGVAPAQRVPDLSEQIGERARVRHVWDLTTGRQVGGEPEYLPLDVISDTAAGLSRRGVVRLALPGADDLGAPENDVRRDLLAGVGAGRPPRLDDADKASRLVAWLRLRPIEAVERLAFSWVGVNAVEIDQRQTATGRVVGTSDGSSGQVFALPASSVEEETFALQVEEPDLGYVLWHLVDDLGTAGAGDAVYELDAEAGTVRFGDGLRGRVPAAGMRVRVAALRAGGGRAGNLPPAALAAISAFDLQGQKVTKLAVAQPLATEGGSDAETLADAERRIPALFRHRDRAVTVEDFRRLAAETPGVDLGRVEVLPRFKPQQRWEDVPGVVSVMVLPSQPARRPPNPRADRPLIEAVFAWLDVRRPLTCELYVIGCEYIPLALAVGVEIRDGFGHDQVLNDVREALRAHLWPLAPGGPAGDGWPLGRKVEERELVVVVARVPGVQEVSGVRLFTRETVNGELRWQPTPPGADGQAALGLEIWQLPELLAVAVAAGDPPDSPGSTGGSTGAAGGVGSGNDAIPVPVVPEVC